MKIYYFDEEGNLSGEGTSATLPEDGATEIAPSTSADKWNGTTWEIPITLLPTLDESKEQKNSDLKQSQKAELETLLGVTAEGETDSFVVQENEARAWNSDNTIATPFIDALLSSRAIESETKQSLVTLIIQKADAYAVAYATILGKFHRLTKQVETATTVEEIEAVVW
jgi:hypothetical protein